MRRFLVLLTSLTTVLATWLAPSPAAAATTTARSLLYQLTVAAEGGSTTYSRTYFKTWTDTDGDSCNTREEVLIAESKVSPVRVGLHRDQR